MWLQLDRHAIGLGDSVRKDIRYWSGGFERMLVDYTNARVTLSRLCNMLDKEDTVHPGSVKYPHIQAGYLPVSK
jgi:hypothetical protein